MGCDQSKPAVEVTPPSKPAPRPVPKADDGSSHAPRPAPKKPQAPPPGPAKKNVQDGKAQGKAAATQSPEEYISKMTQGKPLDASDITDFSKAKREIMFIRKHAQQFLDNLQVAGEDDVERESSKEPVDRAARIALYEKEDVTSFKKKTYEKSDEQKTLIHDAIKANVLFENDSKEEILEIVDVFKPAEFKKGDAIIKQGDQGDLFFVVETGQLSIHVTVGEGEDESEVKVGDYGPGSAFGELALIFGSPRAATITATTDCKLWSLERQAYRGVIGQLRYQEREEKLAFLKSCQADDPSFKVFDASQIEDLAIAVQTDDYKEGDVILREGEVGDTFYIIRSGTVELYQKGQDNRIDTLNAKQSFGMDALVKKKPVEATHIAASAVSVYYLTREDFERMLGNLQDAIDGKTVSRMTMRQSSKRTFKTSMTMDKRYNLTLGDLDFFNVLGKGAFGKVTLVQSKENKKVFALKAQSKHYIIAKGQKEHVLNEYRILKEFEHPNILGIHCAMQDKKYIYFLLDLLPGGELMPQLTKRGRFTEAMTRFYAASVVLAFEQLHALMIAYRDIKPENLVLDRNGYCVLVDFGLSKDIDEGQTFTFCGTPDYLAPEIIRGTGHDWAVDYWGLGIFLFELTNGTAPFYALNQARRTRKILKGYDFVKAPSHFSGGLCDLISNLLISDQAKRLGRTQSGIQAIMNHRWFAGFDWEGLLEKRIEVPIKPSVPSDIKTLGKPDKPINDSIGAIEVEIPDSEWWPDLENVGL